jgi:hypothetical protein
MIVRSGVRPADLIEGMCVWSVIIGTFVASTMNRAIRSAAPGARPKQSLAAPVAISLGWLLAAQMMIMPTSNGEYHAATAIHTADLDSLWSRIANSSGPVLSDGMVQLLRAGKEVPWEPARLAALARQGLWNERLIIDRIEAHEFAMIVTSGRPGTPLYDSRYSPGVSRAIKEAYPYTERVAGRTLHRPPD